MRAKSKKNESRINWNLPANKVDQHIRGLSPFPGAWCEINGERVKVHMSEHLKYNNLDGSQAGTVLEEDLTVACSQGAVRLIEVQPAGKSKMSAQEFLKGRKVLLKNVLK